MANVKVKDKSEGGVFVALPQPDPQRIPENVDPATGEIKGKAYEFHTQENVDAWWDIFCEMATCEENMNTKRFMPVTRASDEAYSINKALRAKQAEKAQKGLEQLKTKERVKKHNSQRKLAYYLTEKGEYPW